MQFRINEEMYRNSYCILRIEGSKNKKIFIEETKLLKYKLMILIFF